MRETMTRETIRPMTFTTTTLRSLLLVCGLAAVAYAALIFFGTDRMSEASPIHEIEILICGVMLTVAVGCGLIAAGQERR
jgi:hypothetical protein